MMTYLIAAALSVGCAVSAVFFLRAYREERFVRAFWLKGAAAAFFVAVGGVMLFSRPDGGDVWLVLLGLVFGLCGDQLLAMRLIHRKYHDQFFTVGALSFAVGHFLYMASQLQIGDLRLWIILPAFLIGAALSLAYARRQGTNAGEKNPLAMGYIAIVLLMACTALSAAVTSGSPAGILFAFGGIMFTVSDNILCAFCYGKSPVWKQNRAVHITYYAAQLAIAWSILFI